MNYDVRKKLYKLRSVCRPLSRAWIANSYCHANSHFLQKVGTILHVQKLQISALHCKGSLHYISPVGWCHQIWSFSKYFCPFHLRSSSHLWTKYFPSPNIFIMSLLYCSPPQQTKYFPQTKWAKQIKVRMYIHYTRIALFTWSSLILWSDFTSFT